MNHAIIFTGAGHEVTFTRMSGAKKIANVCESMGWEVDVVDHICRWSIDQVEQYLKQTVTPKTKWIGISYTFLAKQYDYVKNLLVYIQSQYPDLLYIVGGSSSFLETLPADYFVSGFAENAIIKILNYEFGDGPPPMFEKRHGGRYINATRDYPAASAQSYSVEYKDTDYITQHDVLTIELARGCKFKCAYCAYPFVGIKEDTSATEESIYAELMNNYQRWGTTHYITADDTLNDRTEKLIKLRNVINRLDFKPTISSYVRADLFKAHPEHLELLAECNVIGQFYGIETFHHKAGQIIGKGMNPDTMKQVLIDSKEYFTKNMDIYRGFTSFIIGLPYETEESIWNTVEWLNNNWSDQAANFHTLIVALEGEYVSAMGQNLSKYGYSCQPHALRPTGQMFDKNMIDWTSPWLTNERALSIRPTILNALKLKKVSPFALQNYIAAIGMNKFKVLEERGINDLNTLYMNEYNKHVDTYITNKLNSRL